ncbi:MAG: alpha-1,4-glucan--maltose-1-phosphate maltosyltransferase [Chloroflexota bacterium]
MKSEEMPEGRQRIVIEGVSPEVDCGRFPVKRTAGETLTVTADIFADGHDVINARLLYRKESSPRWTELPMTLLVNDRWEGIFPVQETGRYRYTLVAWVDRFQTWCHNLKKKHDAGQDLAVDFLEGAELIEAAAERAPQAATTLREGANTLRDTTATSAARTKLALSKKVAGAMARYAERRFAVTYHRELTVVVDRERGRFSTWYEVFPRSCSPEPGRHGTFRDCAAWLPYISGMGFDVLYLPPIHPIGRTNRKGKNNAVKAAAGDPGTPWAIGAREGGHKTVHPELGTLADFRELVQQAREHDMEIALDIALQCSPDHPYVREHPAWFRWRPDGTVQYAENPPKKYQDIYPLEFATEEWRELWEEMKSIFLFWIEQGVRIFRVDNPHTKPFPFWEWLITEIKRDYPEVLFLAEAFTRPKIMYRLAKLGFTQSYTYFTWRTLHWELVQYFTELTQTPVEEIFRPNLWPNTPDILSDFLRDGGRPAFAIRLLLAATLGASYGIYGPAFELGINRRKDTASEEYLASEKYELKHWDREDPDSLKDTITRVNRIRRENPALQSNASLHFHDTDNDRLLAYSKRTEDGDNVILTVVNLDYRYTQSAWTDLSLAELGVDPALPFHVTDLFNETRYTWQGRRNYIELNPRKTAAHIFRVSQ